MSVTSIKALRQLAAKSINWHGEKDTMLRAVSELQAATTRIAELEAIRAKMDITALSEQIEMGKWICRALEAEEKLSEALAKISRYENQPVVYRCFNKAQSCYEYDSDPAELVCYGTTIQPLIAKPP